MVDGVCAVFSTSLRDVLRLCLLAGLSHNHAAYDGLGWGLTVDALIVGDLLSQHLDSYHCFNVYFSPIIIPVYGAILSDGGKYALLHCSNLL